MRRTSSTSDSRGRLFAKSAVFVLGLVLLLGAVQFVVFPRHDRDQLWSDYMSLRPGSVDVLLLGTSLVHANVNPAAMWEDSGIRAYALSGSEQSLLTTLPYLQEALRVQKPAVVVLDLHMLSTENFPLSENQKRSNLTMMPMGLPKLRAISSATPASEWTRYLVPLEQFHSRWAEIERDDFDPRKWRQRSDNLFLGYRKIDKIEPQQPSGERRPFDEKLYEQNYRAVSEIIGAAEDAGARVLLVVGPSSRTNLHDEWLKRLEPDLARDHPNARILDTPSRVQEMGVDYATDYYDVWHLNSGGAEKYSAWLGRQLSEQFGLPREGSEDLDSAWRAALARYRRAVEDR